MWTVLLLGSVAVADDDILFVGNSYIISNDLPGVVASVYEAAGQRAVTDKLASGGLTLASHAERAADESSPWYAKLVTEAAEREWVVLQDQSQIPGFPQTNTQWVASRDGAVYLDGLVEDAQAETLFFLTWGYRDGDVPNAWLFPDFSTMLGHLTDGYVAYAEACASADRPVWVVPVGPAFAVIHDQIVAEGGDPTEPGTLFHSLYSGDGSHPSPLGTQLAAYVFFAAITGETPVGLEAPSGFDSETIATLQEAAALAVFSTEDAFDFPWEATIPQDPDPGVDTVSDTEDSPEDTPPLEDSSHGDKSDGSKKTGCATSPAGPGWGWVLLGIIGILTRFRSRH
jgi:MYXO-CTERM domain-containing protein